MKKQTITCDICKSEMKHSTGDVIKVTETQGTAKHPFEAIDVCEKCANEIFKAVIKLQK